MTGSSTTSDGILTARGITVEYRMQGVKSSTLKEHLLQKLSGKAGWVVSRALNDVSLTMKRGECVALIGHNGCGKSTLLKVIAGILKPVSGTLAVEGRIAPLIELGAGFDPELTGHENVLLSCTLMGLTRAEVEARLPAVKEFAELGGYFEQPVKTYSSGMYMRLGFSCAMAIDADLLLIDEILAVGDENFQRKCFARLNAARKANVSIVLVTHDLSVVRQMADRVLVMDAGEVQFVGPPRTAVSYYLDIMDLKRIRGRPSEDLTEAERRRAMGGDVAATVASGAARIVRVSARGTASDQGALLAGRPWGLDIEYEVTEPFGAPPTVGYGLMRPDGLRIAGGNTRERSLADTAFGATLASTGRRVVSFEFERLALASGRYSIVAAIHNQALDRTIEIIADATAFSVLDIGDTGNEDNDVLPSYERGTTNIKISGQTAAP